MIDHDAVKPGRMRPVMAILVVLLAAGGGLLYIFSNQPSRGVVKTASTDSNVRSTIGASKEEFSGKYVSFEYGSSYVVKAHDTDERVGAVILESAYLSESSSFSKKISVGVRHLPSGSVDDDPDYIMRKQNPDRYRMERFDFDGKKGTSFLYLDQGSFEKAFFLLNGDMMASIVLIAPGAEDEKLDAEAEALVRSVRWTR